MTTTTHAVAAHRSRTRHRLGRSTKVVLIVLAISIGLAIVIRLILDPIATQQTRKALNQLEGFRGDFQRVHVTLFSPGYDITQIKLVQIPAGPHEEPLFYAERVHVTVSLRQLLHGHLVAGLRLEHPKLAITQEPTKKAPEKAKRAPDLSRQLPKITALKVDRIEVVDGELLFQERAGSRKQQLWIHRLELAAQNLATRQSLAGRRPATVTAHGEVGHSGELTLFVSADPFASPLSFAGQLAVVGLRASELYEFIEPKAHLQAAQGTIDIFAEFTSKGGVITGGVKPVLKNIEVRPTESGLGNRMKAWLADKSIELASDRVPGRNAVTSTIPIKGRLTDPDIQLWPTVLGVIRNAFVQGLASGFTNVPPETSSKPEGVLTQAKNALKKDQGPPKAQPVKP
jgi:hypothetical protein